ncbi:hypothetical protein [Streptomyces sp. NPDC005302]
MFEFGDVIRIVNNYGQAGTATVIHQDGDTLTVDYLNCMHTFDVSRVIG